jgi:hypothetical protein
LFGVLSKVSRERGKEGEGREPGRFWHKLKLFFKYPKFSNNIFPERKKNLWRKMKNVLK